MTKEQVLRGEKKIPGADYKQDDRQKNRPGGQTSARFPQEQPWAVTEENLKEGKIAKARKKMRICLFQKVKDGN